MSQLLYRTRVIAASIILSSTVTVCVGKLAAAQDSFVGTTQLYVGSQAPSGFFDQSTPITTSEEALADSNNGQYASVSGSVGIDTETASASASTGGTAIIDQDFYDTISASNLSLTGTTVDLNAYITVGTPIVYVSGDGSYSIDETLSISNSSVLFGPSEFLSYDQSDDSLYGLSTSSDTSKSIPIIIGDKYTIDLGLDVRVGTGQTGDVSVYDDPGFYFNNIPDDLTITSSSGASYAAPATAPEDPAWAVMAALMFLGGLATFCNIRRTHSLSADQGTTR